MSGGIGNDAIGGHFRVEGVEFCNPLVAGLLLFPVYALNGGFEISLIAIDQVVCICLGIGVPVDQQFLELVLKTGTIRACLFDHRERLDIEIMCGKYGRCLLGHTCCQLVANSLEWVEQRFDLNWYSNWSCCGNLTGFDVERVPLGRRPETGDPVIEHRIVAFDVADQLICICLSFAEPLEVFLPLGGYLLITSVDLVFVTVEYAVVCLQPKIDVMLPEGHHLVELLQQASEMKDLVCERECFHGLPPESLGLDGCITFFHERIHRVNRFSYVRGCREHGIALGEGLHELVFHALSRRITLKCRRIDRTRELLPRVAPVFLANGELAIHGML